MSDKDLDAVAGAIGGFMAACVVAILHVVILSVATVLCWNRAVPAVFGLPEITFTQAMWLTALVAIHSTHWRRS
jgi:hypothetical protein